MRRHNRRAALLTPRPCVWKACVARLSKTCRRDSASRALSYDVDLVANIPKVLRGTLVDRATWLGSLALLLWALLALLSRAAAILPPFQLAAMAFAVSGGMGLTWLWSVRRLGVLRLSPLAWLHGVGG